MNFIWHAKYRIVWLVRKGRRSADLTNTQPKAETNKIVYYRQTEPLTIYLQCFLKKQYGKSLRELLIILSFDNLYEFWWNSNLIVRNLFNNHDISKCRRCWILSWRCDRNCSKEYFYQKGSAFIFMVKILCDAWLYTCQ